MAAPIWARSQIESVAEQVKNGVKRMPSKEFEALREQMLQTKMNPNLPIAESRAKMDAVAELLPPDREVQVTPVKTNDVVCEWLDWPDIRSKRVLLYIHGGGYCFGSAATHRDLASRIAKAGDMRVLNVDYRLAPEHPYPAAQDDVVSAYEWLLAQGIDADQICVAGDSAGGGLTLTLLLELKQKNLPQPGCAICLSPLTDNSRSGESFEARANIDPISTPSGSRKLSEWYLGDIADPTEPLISALFGDLAGLPPLQIFVGTAEILYDDSTRFAEKARRAGVSVDLQIWEEMFHIWPYFAQAIPEGREAVSLMGTFISEHIPS